MKPVLASPFPEACICANFRKASRAITQAYDSALRPSGIRATQFNILSAIRAVGEANLSWLSEELLMDQTTLTRSLQLLQRKGLVGQVPHPDGPRKLLRLSEKGEAVQTAAQRLWATEQKKMAESLRPSEWDALQQALATLIARARPE